MIEQKDYIKIRKQQIFAKLIVEGLHYWPDCDIDEVDYLKNIHRHNFEIICYAYVTDNDREIEFIKLKHEILNWLRFKYYNNKYDCLDFASMSCESISDAILNAFPVFYKCSVSEDGENGAIIELIDA